MASEPSQDEVFLRVRRQLQEQQMEELVRAMTDKCFEKCVKKPGKSLSTSEQQCIAKSMDRYMEVMALVFNTVARKAQS
ncbi:Mitochondrial import inner membrane translocase subunit Tim13-A [Gracilariopsis chorda]|uniref:Mitochondrial import inner membrane translocase subunit n=1 Tax=Gracilariopsis chorda TaxID=448386 RepID=A0A2V3IUH0_9FLOR|nr:Mitochondrial import inner membrane translocase subunit Tim13-A [Gracilariopsis chorda]|eukprot:PXF44770.1 Mitochondrial import inner membrane translocase subunit Tim13-A [Gracilariopsis chorda]